MVVGVEGPGEPLVMLGGVRRRTRVAVLLHLGGIFSSHSLYVFISVFTYKCLCSQFYFCLTNLRGGCLGSLSLLLLLIQLLDRLDLFLQLHPSANMYF